MRKLKLLRCFIWLMLMSVPLVVVAQEKICAEDFSNTYAMMTPGVIDTFRLADEYPRVTSHTLYDRRLDNGLDSGKWGGYTAVGGVQMFMGNPMDVGTISLLSAPGSTFGTTVTLGMGYLLAMTDTLNNEDETGNWFCTYFPTNAIDLSGDDARIEWDECDRSSMNTTGSVTLMLRATGVWIVSEIIPVSITNTWQNAAVVSMQPNALSWNFITSPGDAVLTALAPNDEAPLVFGGPIPPAMLAAILQRVDGFGFVVAVNLSGSLMMPVPGLCFDAVHLKGNVPVTAVRDWYLY